MTLRGAQTRQTPAPRFEDGYCDMCHGYCGQCGLLAQRVTVADVEHDGLSSEIAARYARRLRIFAQQEDVVLLCFACGTITLSAQNGTHRLL